MVETGQSEGGVRYRWVVLVVAFLVHATCIALIWQAVPPLKQAMAPDLGTPWQQVVVVYAAVSFGLVFTQLPGGALGDKYPVRYVVGLGAVFAGLATALRFAVPSLLGQVLVSVVAAVGMGLVNPNLIKVVTEWFPSRQLGLGQGILMSGNTLAAGLALSLSAGTVLGAVGDWQGVFLLYGGLTVAAGVLWLLLVRSPHENERPTNPETGLPFSTSEGVPLRESLSAVLRSPSTPWAVALTGLAFWAILGSLAVLPEFADAHTFDVPEYLLGTPLFLATIGAIGLPVLSDKYSRRLGLYMGILGLSLGVLLTGVAPSLPAFVLGMAVAGLFGGGLNAMFYLLPGELADIDPTHVGTMAGVILSLSQIGAVAASIAGAQVLTAYGLEASAVFVAGPTLVGLLLVTKLHLDGRGEVAAQETVAAGVGDD
ncbi:MFS transporter [Halorarius litoreus]|uniref:MFS transporter n=1 Tax=Halorarius litoreus TaxID=2962676 RepID=UPI0020CEA8FA|nr:MFS transporter [Halorarius litoreus]